jgi:hypothetical protein
MSFVTEPVKVEWDRPPLQTSFQATMERVREAVTSIYIPTTSSLTYHFDESLSEDYLISVLDRLYLFQNYNSVYRFIKKNSFLTTLLFEAYSEIQSVFNENILRLNVETVIDTETNEEKLYIFINTNLSPDEAYDALDLIDENWWIDNIHKSQFKMNIDLEL